MVRGVIHVLDAKAGTRMANMTESIRAMFAAMPSGPPSALLFPSVNGGERQSDPFVLEFLGLDEKAAYSEHDLEASIIDKLESFLLELGEGFLFEARQKRFTFDSDHFYVDLVFYNRLLRCYVLIDLKIGKLTHQDLGQMQMHVNYFDRQVKLPEENPTVGIVLCRYKHDALVKLTLPKDANIYASQYQLYLPSKEELQRKLRD